MCRRLRFLVWLVTCWVSCVALAESTTLVGALGDLDRLVIEGNRDFSAAEIKWALRRNLDVQRAVTPTAPLDGLSKLLSKKLTAGYQHSGYVNAQVVVSHDSAAERLVARVNEGPRFVAGEIDVRGVQTINANHVVAWLTEERSKDDLRRTVLFGTDDADSSDDDEKDEPVWKHGEPVSFDETFREKAKECLTRALGEAGYFFPKFDLDFELNAGDGTAALVIQFEEEGSRGIVGEIDFSGLKKNTSEQVLKYLGVQPDVALDRALLRHIEQKLWQSGRFRQWTVRPIAAGADGLRLRIDLIENEPAPALGEELSAEEAAALRVGEWLEHFSQSDYDLVIRSDGTDPFADTDTLPPPWDGLVVASPRRGVLIEFQGREEPYAPADLILCVDRDRTTIISGTQHSRWVIPKSDAQAVLKMQLRPIESDSKKKTNLTIGFGFQSRDAEKSPFKAAFSIAPAAILYEIHRDGTKCRLENGLLIWSLADGDRRCDLRADATTGKVLEIKAGRFRIEFEKGRFAAATAKLDASASELPNQYESDAATVSLIKFALREWAAYRQHVANDVSRELPSHEALAAIVESAALTWEEVKAFSDDSDFRIPLANQTIPSSPAARLMLVACYSAPRLADAMFPRESWPWTVMREAAFCMTQRADLTAHEIKRVLSTPTRDDVGPVGVWLIAEAFRYLGNTHYGQLAEVGLGRLDTPSFWLDTQLLFEKKDSPFAIFVGRLGTHVRTWKTEEVQSVADQLPSDLGEVLIDWAKRMRLSPKQSEQDAFADALSHGWAYGLGNAVEYRLRLLVEEAKIRQARAEQRPQ